MLANKSSAQHEIPNVLTASIECGNLAFGQTGSFMKRPEVAVGIQFGYLIHDLASSAFVVSLGITISNTYDYRLRSRYDLIDYYYRDYRMYSVEYDERLQYRTLSIGLHPEYRWYIDDDASVSVFCGSELGIGFEDLTSNLVSRTLIDSATVYYSGTMYGIHGEYNMNGGFGDLVYDLGIRLNQHWYTVGLRFEYIDVLNRNSLLSHSRNLYLQIGLVL